MGARLMDGWMDGNFYVQILEDELQQSLECHGNQATDIIFQQDNDPPKYVQEGYQMV